MGAVIRGLGLCLVVGAMGACSDVSDYEPPKGDPDAGDDTVEEGACSNMDLIFVIDDSGSMEEEQDNLTTNFGKFADLLSNYRNVDGEKVDFRIAVTTTGRDVNYIIDPNPPFPIPGLPTFPTIPTNESGDNGVFRSGCGLSQPWIEGSSPNMKSEFECLASVGIAGASMEMPLLMTQWALKDRVADGSNAGFIRDDALLGLIILTDEDDCSRYDNGFTVGTEGECGGNPQIHPIAQTIDTLDQVKQGRGRWAGAIIAGTTDCSSAFGDAAKADRLLEFAGQAGDQVVASSICTGDLTPALQTALDTFTAACDTFPNPD